MGSITRKHLNRNLEIIGVFSSSLAYLQFLNMEVAGAEEGMTYYDTTLNQLRTYDGSSWSPAGQNSNSPGSLDSAAQIGTKITNAVAIEIEATSSASSLFILDADGTTNAAIFDVSSAGGSGKLIDLDQNGTGYDIDGTDSKWYTTKDGAGLFNSLSLLDGKILEFGNTVGSGDVNMRFSEGTPGTAGTGLLIAGNAAAEQVQFGDASYDMDVLFIGTGTTSNYMHWDASADALLLKNADIKLGDNDQIILGNSSDVLMDWDSSGSAFQITPLTNNYSCNWGTTSKAWDITIYGDTATSILHWIASTDRLVFESAEGSSDVMLQLDDYAGLTFGEGSNFGSTGTGDVLFNFDGTNFNMVALAASTPWLIGDGTTGFDLTYAFDNGTILFDYDADIAIFNACDLRINDGDFMVFGDDTDATIRWDASAAELEIIGATSFEDDVTTVNLTVTGTLTSTSFDPGDLVLTDDELITFGTGSDFTLGYSESNGNLELEPATANDEFSIGVDTQMDLAIYGATQATEFWLFDASALELECTKTAITFTDGTDICKFGPIASNKMPIESNTQDGFAINIGETNAIDVQIFGGTPANYVLFDTDDGSLDVSLDGFSLTFQDATDGLTFGPMASNVFPIESNTESGHTIQFGATNAVAIEFYTDLGTSQVKWDPNADTNQGTWDFGEDDLGIDVRFYGAAANTVATWDQSADAWLFANGTQIYTTAFSTHSMTVTATDLSTAKYILGSTGTHGMDVTFQAAGNSASVITWDAAGDSAAGVWSYGADDTGIDVFFYGATQNVVVKWDQGSDIWEFGKDNLGPDVKFFSDEASDFMLWDQDGVGHGADSTEVGNLVFEDALVAFVGANSTYRVGIASDNQGNGTTLLFSGTNHSETKVEFGSTMASGVDVLFRNAGITTALGVTWDSADGTLTSGSTANIVTTLTGNDDGLIIPAKAGAPSSTSATTAAIVYDSTNHYLYVWNESAEIWYHVGLST